MSPPPGRKLAAMCGIVGYVEGYAEGFAAGELKHGPIALVEEVRARGARTIALIEEGDEAVVPYADHLVRVPATPVLLQVFACEPATARGNAVDQPRNLAKSVTVE